MATGLFNLKQVNQAISQGAWSGYIAPRWVEYLVVAGGGGSCSSNGQVGGGGGGAGGLLTGIVTVATGTSYTVTVGTGGSGGANSNTNGGNGNNSVFGSISATGGGGGTTYNNAVAGSSGGSSGGGSYRTTNIGQGIVGQGNTGGLPSTGAGDPAGGGGGAGTVGLPASGSVAGNGGAGIASAITGTVVVYAGGGGGGAYSPAGGVAGNGGVGGGGAGSNNLTLGATGGANTGGGGGGAGATNTGALTTVGAAGGSGIVVVRYPGNVQFYTGGTVNYNNGYIIHIFTASGTLAPTTPTPYNTSYQISRSLRFNSADSAYLSRTPAGSGNRQIFTFSAWVKRSKLSTATANMFGGGASATNFTEIYFSSSDDLRFYDYASSTSVYSSSVYRDVSAWYHIVYAIDTTQATAANRVKIYVNGTQLTSFSTANYPAQNANMYINTAGIHSLGALNYTASVVDYFDGYMTEINFIDGQALTPSSFGATSTTTGVWAPIQYSGTYGTNGFYVNFSDNSNTTAATLGKDYSGNGNNWTPNNFSVTAGAGNDSLVDSPTQYGFDTGVGGTVRGNYCTFNPLFTGGTLANGNLDFSAASGIKTSLSTIALPTSGKWYWEVTVTAVGNSFQVGIGGALSSGTSYLGSSSDAYAYSSNAVKYNNGSSTAYGASYTTNDVIAVAYDADAGTLVFYKNNTSQGTAFSSLSGTFFPAVSYGSSSGSGSCTINFGQRPFAYTAPSGFKALCTQNLPTPTIGATSNTLASSFFAPVLYTGNNGTQSITVGFQPDFLWIKSRSGALNHNIWDSVRTRSKFLYSNLTNAEATSSAGVDLISFDTNGFTLGQDSSGNSNSSGGVTYVAWNWKAGNNAGASNSAGSITSTVSANTTSGFSVVTYTGTGANATIGHGLGVAPSMIISKSRSNALDWDVYHSALGPNYWLRLNSTIAAVNNSAMWRNVSPTSTVWSIGTDTENNTNGATYVAYCFAEVAGYSKFGSFTGNGSADGPFVYTGFRPAYVMIKKTNSTSDWLITDAARDTFNVVNKELDAQGAFAEGSGFSFFDYLSNGFKSRGTNPAWNTNGDTYIYIAFASNPFKYSLAR